MQNEKFKTINISELILILKTQKYEIKDSRIGIPISDGTKSYIPIYEIGT